MQIFVKRLLYDAFETDAKLSASIAIGLAFVEGEQERNAAEGNGKQLESSRDVMLQRFANDFKQAVADQRLIARQISGTKQDQPVHLAYEQEERAGGQIYAEHPAAVDDFVALGKNAGQYLRKKMFSERILIRL